MGIALFSFGLAVGVAAALVVLRSLISKARLHRADPAGDELVLFGVGRPLTLQSASQCFRAGTFMNIGGDFTIDFTDAALAPAGGHLIVVTAGGGTEITVAEGWEVLVTTPTRAAAVINHTRAVHPPATDPPGSRSR